jgi:uroporphyrinogen decarboxylase
MEKMKSDLFLEFRKKIAYFSKNKKFYEQDIEHLNSYDLAGVVYPDNQGFIDFLKDEKSFFVQGNFSPESIRKKHPEYLSDFQKFVSQMQQLSKKDRKGWLCSLSHGVLPKTPENNVRHFVKEIRNTFS